MLPNQLPTRAALALLAAAAWSVQQPAGGAAQAPRPAAHRDELGRRPPHGPPPEAFEACAEKSEGDACSVEFHERTLSGSCVPAREQDALFCMPDDMPPPPDGPPPR